MKAVEDLHIVGLLKGGERYFWIYENAEELVDSLGRAAADPELNFSWRDATKVIAEMRRGLTEGAGIRRL